MSEKIQRLVMHAFRGVPGEMSVDFGDGESIVVYGDNGTGKSTIADALEWYFTGEIELLSHEGRQHAVRHVGGDDQDVTSVEVFTTGALGGKAVIPDERPPEAFQAMRRETFLLRGRSLADFINKTKTEKWKALVEILGLDAIEDLREDLQRARNDLRKESKAAEEQVRQYARALSSGNEAATPEGVLASVQQFCEMLGVDPPGSLDQAVDPAWLRAAVGATERDEPESQEHLLNDIRSLATPAIDAKLLKGWNALVSSERARLFPRASLVREARRLVETHPAGGRCPVCGQSITDKELAKKIERALADVMDASRELERLRDPIAEWAEDLDAAIDTRTALHERARAAAFTLPPVPSLPSTGLQSCLDSLAAIDIEAVTACVTGLKNWDKAAGKLVKEPGAAEASTRDTQLLMLAGLCDQIRGWQQARQKSARALRALTLAERVFDAYQAKQKADLSAILEKISHRVAEIYAALHPGEDFAEAVTIEPWTAKGVELAVEFYGSRQRPPHGVLSESHLNSLAIAVFLAMAETFNKQLGFLLLDDVINSFDVEHRGQLAQLLAEGFSTWQLIVLTHDQQFFEHLSRRAPSWRKVELTSWSYGSGPRTTQYKTSGILAAARERLGSGDVHGAATKARRALEEQLQEVCEALWAPLPFRRGQANDKREIGELFKGVRRALKDRAKTMLDSVEPLLKNLEADVGATLNVEVHGSRGRSGASEVEAALNRIQALDGIWSCPECGTRVWHRGNPEAGRCRCGQRAFPPVGVNPL